MAWYYGDALTPLVEVASAYPGGVVQSGSDQKRSVDHDERRKSSTSIRQIASMPSSGYSSTSMAELLEGEAASAVS
jgi:ribosomal protein S7